MDIHDQLHFLAVLVLDESEFRLPMDYVRDGKIQGQCAFKKTKERPCITPSLT